MKTSRRRPIGAAVLCAALAACGGSTQWTPFTIGGEVAQPRRVSEAGFAPVPLVRQDVEFSSAGAVQAHAYVGASLWGLLEQAQVQVDPAVKNDLLDKVVVATGSDGYRAVFALGELSPDFGNRGSVVAYEEIVRGETVATDPDTVTARVTAPGDVKGGRYVALLARIDVRDSGSAAASVGGGASGSFTVSGDVLHPGRFDLAALQALAPASQAVGTDTYTGISLWTLLNATAGLKMPPTAKNGQLAMYVVATGTDGYKAVLALGELDPGFGNQPDLVATSMNGVPLAGDGFARIVVPHDVKHGRWVSNLASLEVFTAAP